VNVAPLPRLAVTAMEAPQVLGISDDHFRRYVSDELRWVRKGSKKLVALTELQAWLERNAARVLEESPR